MSFNFSLISQLPFTISSSSCGPAPHVVISPNQTGPCHLDKQLCISSTFSTAVEKNWWHNLGDPVFSGTSCCRFLRSHFSRPFRWVDSDITMESAKSDRKKSEHSPKSVLW